MGRPTMRVRRPTVSRLGLLLWGGELDREAENNVARVYQSTDRSHDRAHGKRCDSVAIVQRHREYAPDPEEYAQQTEFCATLAFADVGRECVGRPVEDSAAEANCEHQKLN